VIEKLRVLRLTNAAELVETAFEETLAYYAFPQEHWRRIAPRMCLTKRLLGLRS